MPTHEEAEFATAHMTDNLPEQALAIGQRPRPRRPGRVMNIGRALRIRANHFKVLCNLQEAHHYDVEIQLVPREGGEVMQSSSGIAGRQAAKPLPTEVCREVMKAVAAENQWRPGWAYDGRKSMHAPGIFLPQDRESVFEVEARDEGRKRPFKVMIKWVNSVSIANLMRFIGGQVAQIPQESIQALDVALMHGTNLNPTCTPFGRNFFFHSPGMAKPLGGGAEVWLGYNQSLRALEMGLTLNVDVASTAFVQEQPVTQLVARAAGIGEHILAQGLSGHQFRAAQKAVQGLKVTSSHLQGSQRKYKVKGLTDRGASGMMFDKDGTQMSVAHYFEEAYKIRLRLPGAPLLNVGTSRRINWLPMELTTVVPGQRVKKLDSQQAAQMPKLAGTQPNVRSEMISKYVTEMGRLPTDPTVRAFEMSVGSTMAEIPARILPAPDLQYAERTPSVNTGQTGAWNLRTVRFNQGKKVPAWAVASFTDPYRTEHELKDMLANLCNVLVATGIEIPSGQLPPIAWHSPANFVGETLQDATNAGRQTFGVATTLLLVCLPTNGTELYREVKRASDGVLGVASQCFVASKAGIGAPPKRRDQYCANVAMKINAKLGGINVRLAGSQQEAMPHIGRRPVMFLGADVTHPVTFAETEPSIASVVGSLDPATAQYASRIMIQGHRVEVIPGMRGAVKELLGEFYSKNKRLPEMLVMYRDGVSEGQFDEVQQKELPQIRAACEDIKQGYTPPITFIVVQKRHHTRIFPIDNNRDNSGNVLPGTLVDQGITHPTEYDFYLNSHAGLQGTNRPTHYHVLYDENKFPAEALCLLTYRLCYLFCRCTRSVSVVPPAYYAHLAAMRGRLMCLHGEDSETASTSTGGGARAPVELISVHPQLHSSMFYV